MTINTFLQEAKKFEIQVYKKPKNLEQLKDTHVPFTGSPRKHPYDTDKLILVADPYSTNIFYYEFNSNDIDFVEEMSNIVNINGETVQIVRIWLKKMSIGMRCTPFIIGDTR